MTYKPNAYVPMWALKVNSKKKQETERKKMNTLKHCEACESPVGSIKEISGKLLCERCADYMYQIADDFANDESEAIYGVR